MSFFIAEFFIIAYSCLLALHLHWQNIYNKVKFKSIHYENREKRCTRVSRIGKVEEEKIIGGTKVKTFIYDDTDILYNDEKYELRIEIQNEVEYVVNIRDVSLYTGKVFINIFDEDAMKIVKEEQEYIEGLSQRIWKIYSQNGDILREEIYQKGIKV